MNEKYQEDSRNLFLTKSQEIHKEGNFNQLSKSTLETISFFLNPAEILKNEIFFANNLINFLINTSSIIPEELDESNIKNTIDLKQFSEFSDFVENIKSDSAEFEKILNKLCVLLQNNLSLVKIKGDFVDFKMDEKKLAIFIIFLCKILTWSEDKESKYSNKGVLKAFYTELMQMIDENNINEKKNSQNFNLENIYMGIKKQLDSLEVKNIFIIFFKINLFMKF